MAEISIIMPLYNAQRYLCECLDSIFAQTFQDFELICVDDCSTDGTMNIIQNYSRTEHRMKIFSNKEHKGAAYSRNKGMKEACGRYLVFLDGDDVFDSDLLALSYHKAVESGADIVVYRSVCVSSDRIHQMRLSNLPQGFVRRYCEQTFMISELSPHEYLLFTSTPWDKIYKREFIAKERLEFQNLQSCNDCYFVNMALLLAKKITFLDTDKPLVYARMHDTPSRISYRREPMCAYWAEEKIWDELILRGKAGILFRHYFTRMYFHFCMVVRNTKDLMQAKGFYKFLQEDGISRLQDMDRESYANLDVYIKEALRKFISESYETGWFDAEDKVQICMYCSADKIQNMFKKWKTEGKRIGIWGIEKNAHFFLNLCNQYNLEVDEVMDRDAEKQGQKILNFPVICSPQTGYSRVQIILFTKGNVMEEAKKIIDNRVDIELINLISYLDIY